MEADISRDDPEHPSAAHRRLRRLYSLQDLQLALSAATFLRELDFDAPISTVELRRFKCYETTAVIAYARPFTRSEGRVPALTLKMTGVTLTQGERELHDKILTLRNRVVAHSDAELMRMAVRLFQDEEAHGSGLIYLQIAFDEGLHFNDLEVFQLTDLIGKIHFALYQSLRQEAKAVPSRFDLDIDHLKRHGGD